MSFIAPDNESLSSSSASQQSSNQDSQSIARDSTNYLLIHPSPTLSRSSQSSLDCKCLERIQIEDKIIVKLKNLCQACKSKEKIFRQQSRSLDKNLAAAAEVEDDHNVDSGYAWIILAVMFLINASTFGSARAYGLIFDKLARNGDEGRAMAALPFTIMGSVEYMAGPLTSYLLNKMSWRWTCFIGSCLVTLSHILASIFDSILGRILTMGVMCGFGMSLIMISSFQINNAYFNKYRSRAFGMGLTGAAVGTFYISPCCEWILNNIDINACYLALGAILFPNILLSLLLKPKKQKNNRTSLLSPTTNLSSQLQTVDKRRKSAIQTISGWMKIKQDNSEKNNNNNKQVKVEVPLWPGIKSVLKTPLFHLIWPTQLLFCWFNFVYGMIIVDFGKDRGLSDEVASKLISYWAFGQLIGRLVLGYLIDLKFISDKLFIIICFISIALSTFILNNVKLELGFYNSILISSMVVLLSMFISTIYILFNNLTVEYMEKSIQSLSIGISSLAGSFFLLPRANVIGYFRDSIGNYDSMLTMFTYISIIAALIWLVIPFIIDKFRQFSYNQSSMSRESFERFRKQIGQTNNQITTDSMVDLTSEEIVA